MVRIEFPVITISSLQFGWPPGPVPVVIALQFVFEVIVIVVAVAEKWKVAIKQVRMIGRHNAMSWFIKKLLMRGIVLVKASEEYRK